MAGAGGSESWDGSYLGRILRSDATSLGMCFHVGDGFVVTAATQLTMSSGGPLRVSPLGGDDVIDVDLVRTDAQLDLALLRGKQPFGSVAPGFARTDRLPVEAPLAVPWLTVGPEGDFDAELMVARWTGVSTTGGARRLRVTPEATGPRITSGVPVLTPDRGAVLGIVTAHGSDDPQRTEVWVAASEDVLRFLEPDVSLPLSRHPQATALTTRNLAPAVRSALGNALLFSEQPRRGRPQVDDIETELVLLGVLVHAHATTPGVTEHFIKELRARHSRQLGGRELLEQIATLDGLRGYSGAGSATVSGADLEQPQLRPLVRRATEITGQVSTRGQVRLRHLLAASVLALDFTHSRNSLALLGFSESAVRSALLEAVRTEAPEESAEAWADVLALPEDSLALAGGMSSDRVDPHRGIALADDAIGVGVYVTMLAALIANRATPMPLSIGVFGAWGSGKSYFMGLLREQVRELSAWGRDPYLGEITQIGFNAWHYADTNLWASLGDEIFRQLAGSGTDVEQRRADLSAKLTQRLAQNRLLDADAEHARAETARLRAQLDDAAASRQARAVDLVRALKQMPEISERLDRIWRRLGVSTEAEQGRVLIDQLDGTARQAEALRRAFTNRTSRTATLVAAVTLMALAAAAFVPPHLATWLTRGAGATLASLLAAAVANVGRVQRGLTQLNEIADRLRRPPAEEAPKRHGRKHAHLVAAIREAEENEKALRGRLDDAVARMHELNHELSELEPGRRLYGFLSQKASDSEYTGGLGLVAVMRKDFEQLVALLEDWRRNADRVGGPRPADRIVLYIDDLDRCSPRQVFEVLQAVHLLLALDLFTVVVGVDPEWLRRSIRQQYPDMFAAGPEGAGVGDPTPEGYLEKIFNVPFALPPLTARGVGSLIRRLATEGEPRPQTTETPDTPGGAAERRLRGDSGTEGPAIKSPLPIEQGSEASSIRAGQEPRPPRAMTEPELRLVESLGGLIKHPRDAKRLLNLYRLVRCTRDLAPASRFLGDDGAPGEYQAVIVLLGLLTAEPRLFGPVLDTPPSALAAGGLLHRSPAGSWSDFAAGLQPRDESGGWRNEIAGSIGPADVAAWQRLAEGIAPAGRLIGLPDLAPFHAWAAQIRRFTFTPGYRR